MCCIHSGQTVLSTGYVSVAWRSLEEPISACSGGDGWRDLKWEFLTGLALFAGGRLTDMQLLIDIRRCGRHRHAMS
jgi:hypothetical protein